MVFHGMEGTLIQEMEQVPEPPVQESSVASEGKKLSYDQDGGDFFLPTLPLLSLSSLGSLIFLHVLFPILAF